MTEKIRVLIADDHTILRAGVRRLLEAEQDIAVVGEAANGEEAVALAESLRPDVVMMDVAMPGMDGLDATRRIKSRLPGTNVLVLTMHRSDEYFFQMLQAGASGYVLKGADTNELIDAVREVARGQVFLHPTMTRQLLQDYLSRSREVPGASQASLTAREKEILRLLAQGFSNSEIAAHLSVSTSTVHTHRTNLMRKLNLTSRRELFEYARRHGLIPPAPE